MRKENTMGNAPKSAYEIAMEKLKAKDAAAGESPGRKLTGAEKDQIAGIRSFYESKLAEREIFFRSERAKVAHDPEKLRELEGGYQTDRRRFESERDAKIGKIRG
jgi:hypothetical protein